MARQKSHRFKGANIMFSSARLAMILTCLILAGGVSAADAKSHHAATSKYAKACAAIWPRYLAADTRMGNEEFGETRSPAEIEVMHLKFNSLCLTQGPNAGDIQWLLQHYGS